MKKVNAVFKKQMKDSFKNKTIFIQFILFPVLVVVMENTVQLQDMPRHFFVGIFAAMYVGMAPLTCVASIISEEKEKGTLEMLRMSGVKSWQYLIGIGANILLWCMLGSVVFVVVGEYQGGASVFFLLILLAGILISTLFGAAIGLLCKNQMSATAVTVPVMMLFSFLPMIAMFNEKVKEISRFVYSYQVQSMTQKMQALSGAKKITDVLNAECFWILGINFVAAAVLFAAVYLKKK